jgi:hypothetical protein
MQGSTIAYAARFSGAGAVWFTHGSIHYSRKNRDMAEAKAREVTARISKVFSSL